MAIVDGSLQLGYKDNAWFTANASLVLLVGQIVYLEQTGTYKLGDGVTQLSALTFLGGNSYTLTDAEIGSVINGATSATPNDTDLVMSVESSVAKKNTWTQIKAFLKTYFDTLFVKKGTITNNTILKGSGTDTATNSKISDDGVTVTVNSTTDGESSGNDNFSHKTTTGGYRVGYYVQTGFSTLIEFYTNNVKSSMISDFVGFFKISAKNRFSITNFTTGLTKFWTEMSSGYSGFGNDYFAPNERVEIRDGNLRINDLTASQIVETDASKNLVSAAKGTAYNKNFGTTAGTVLEGNKVASTINFYNVKDYGAVGDGVTDDYTAFNNAITASLAATGNVYLIVPAATYIIGTQLSIDNATANVVILGYGATLKSNINTSSTSILFIQSAKKILIHDLTFDLGAKTTTNHRGLRIGDYTNNKYVGVCRVINCDFTNFGQEAQVGMWVQNTPYISGLAGNQNLPSLLVDGCNFYNQNTTATVNYTTMTNYGVGLRIGERSDYAKVTNCNFNYIRIGVWSEAAANLDLTQCNFLACLPKQGVAYTYGALYVPASGLNNGKINVVACKFNHNFGYSIYVAYAGIERPLTVSSCHFIANATTAIYATHTSTLESRIKIHDNYFERCSQAFTNAWTAQPFGATLQPFIYLNNQLRCSIRLNTFLNDATYGVVTANSADYNLIKNNNWYNITGMDSLVGANNQVADNDNL